MYNITTTNNYMSDFQKLLESYYQKETKSFLDEILKSGYYSGDKKQLNLNIDRQESNLYFNKKDKKLFKKPKDCTYYFGNNKKNMCEYEHDKSLNYNYIDINKQKNTFIDDDKQILYIEYQLSMMGEYPKTILNNIVEYSTLFCDSTTYHWSKFIFIFFQNLNYTLYDSELKIADDQITNYLINTKWNSFTNISKSSCLLQFHYYRILFDPNSYGKKRLLNNNINYYNTMINKLNNYDENKILVDNILKGRMKTEMGVENEDIYYAIRNIIFYIVDYSRLLVNDNINNTKYVNDIVNNVLKDNLPESESYFNKYKFESLAASYSSFDDSEYKNLLFNSFNDSKIFEKIVIDIPKNFEKILKSNLTFEEYTKTDCTDRFIFAIKKLITNILKYSNNKELNHKAIKLVEDLDDNNVFKPGILDYFLSNNIIKNCKDITLKNNPEYNGCNFDNFYIKKQLKFTYSFNMDKYGLNTNLTFITNIQNETIINIIKNSLYDIVDKYMIINRISLFPPDQRNLIILLYTNVEINSEYVFNMEDFRGKYIYDIKKNDKIIVDDQKHLSKNEDLGENIFSTYEVFVHEFAHYLGYQHMFKFMKVWYKPIIEGHATFVAQTILYCSKNALVSTLINGESMYYEKPINLTKIIDQTENVDDVYSYQLSHFLFDYLSHNTPGLLIRLYGAIVSSKNDVDKLFLINGEIYKLSEQIQKYILSCRNSILQNIDGFHKTQNAFKNSFNNHNNISHLFCENKNVICDDIQSSFDNTCNNSNYYCSNNNQLCDELNIPYNQQ